MQLLQTLTDDKVINRLFKLMEKMVKDLKNPAKDLNGNWDVTFYDGLVFTAPNSGMIPNLVSFELDENSSYNKPILEVWGDLNLTMDISELEPLLEFVTKAQKPERVEMYDQSLTIHLPNGNSRTLVLKESTVEAYNDLLENLDKQHEETNLSQVVLSAVPFLNCSCLATYNSSNMLS